MTEQVMKVWELDGPRSLILRTVEVPHVDEDTVLVDIESSVISPGSELAAYRDGPTAMMTRPGYLASGRVLAAGDHRSSIIGQRVVLSAPHGSHAVVASTKVGSVPDGVSAEEACLVHLATLGHRALHASPYVPGDDVAVVGAGLVGMCTALVATLSGARVHLLDVAVSRLERAARLDLATYDANDPGEIDRMKASTLGPITTVIDTTGSWDGLLTSARVVERGGSICVVGMNRTTPSARTGGLLMSELLSFPARFHYEGIRIVGCAGHPRAGTEGTAGTAGWTYERAQSYLLDAMARSRVDFGPLLTERIAYSALPEAMARLDGGTFDGWGVVLDWTSD